jgi:hypothetical protein
MSAAAMWRGAVSVPMSAMIRDIVDHLAPCRGSGFSMARRPVPETAADRERGQVERLKRLVEGEASGTPDEDSDAKLGRHARRIREG